VVLFEKGKVASQIICSTLKEIVEQQQYFFDTLWSKAIPAEDRIYELEHGVESPFIETISPLSAGNPLEFRLQQ
jgi:hypothetical protein